MSNVIIPCSSTLYTGIAAVRLLEPDDFKTWFASFVFETHIRATRSMRLQKQYVVKHRKSHLSPKFVQAAIQLASMMEASESLDVVLMAIITNGISRTELDYRDEDALYWLEVFLADKRTVAAWTESGLTIDDLVGEGAR